MVLDRGLGRFLKLLIAAVLVERLTVSLIPTVRFPLVFLSVLTADILRLRRSTESPLYLEEVVSGILLYAGVGLACWGFDHFLSLYTNRHAGPVFPAILLALIDRAYLSTRRR